MKHIFNNKKAMNTMAVLIGIIISLITFFMYLNFYGNLMPNVVSQTDDLICRSYITAKSSPNFKAVEFFHNINTKCKTDGVIKVDLEDKEKSFDKIATSMARCWYRYGEGKQDFMSNFGASGNWCFVCSKVNIKKDSGSVSYGEFVEWTNTKKFNETSSFYDYITLKYTSVGEEDVSTIRAEYANLLSNPDAGGEMRDLLIVLGDQINYLDDLRFKQLNGDDGELYVVYRYDRIDKSFEEQIQGASEVGGLVFGTVLVSIVAESIAEGAIIGGAIGFWGGGIGAVPGAILGGIAGTVKGGFKFVYKSLTSGVKAFKSVWNVKKLLTSTKDLITYSGAANKVKKSAEMTRISLNEKSFLKVNAKIDTLKIKSEDLDEFIELARTNGKMDMVDDLTNLKQLMKDSKIDNLHDIDKVLRGKQDNLLKVEKLMENDVFKNSDEFLKYDPEYFKLWSELDDLEDGMKNLYALRKQAFDDLNSLKAGITVKDTTAIRTYLKAGVIAGSGMGGAFIGASYEGDSIQYVDVMTQEQYYRLCGTEYYPE